MPLNIQKKLFVPESLISGEWVLPRVPPVARRGARVHQNEKGQSPRHHQNFLSGFLKKVQKRIIKPLLRK